MWLIKGDINMTEQFKEVLERNLEAFRVAAKKENIDSFIKDFESELTQAKYEVSKINDFTAPEEAESRIDYAEYVEEMLKEAKHLKEVLS